VICDIFNSRNSTKSCLKIAWFLFMVQEGSQKCRRMFKTSTSSQICLNLPVDHCHFGYKDFLKKYFHILACSQIWLNCPLWMIANLASSITKLTKKKSASFLMLFLLTLFFFGSFLITITIICIITLFSSCYLLSLCIIIAITFMAIIFIIIIMSIIDWWSFLISQYYWLLLWTYEGIFWWRSFAIRSPKKLKKGATTCPKGFFWGKKSCHI